jgi:hypothetical protein
MSASTRTRETAKRLFAHELREADYMFKEDDDEYAPSYLLLPSGGKANRVFIVGTLTEKEDRDGYYSVRINDSTGNFLLYAGQYQPEAADALRDIEAPAYVAVVGKPDTFETDEGDIISTIRPERVTVVDAETRHKWLAETASQTLERLELDAETDNYAEMADEQYGTERHDLADIVVEALEGLEADSE